MPIKNRIEWLESMYHPDDQPSDFDMDAWISEQEDETGLKLPHSAKAAYALGYDSWIDAIAGILYGKTGREWLTELEELEDHDET